MVFDGATTGPRLIARLYVGFAIAAGGTLLVLCVPQAQFEHPLLFIALLICSSTASAFDIELPLCRRWPTVPAFHLVNVAALAALGAHETILVAAASVVTRRNSRRRGHGPVDDELFSIAGLITSVEGAGLTLSAFQEHASAAPPPAAFALAFVAAGVPYFVLNTAFTATAHALANRQRFDGAWRSLVLANRRRRSETRAVRGSLTTNLTGDLGLATIEALARAIDAKDQTSRTHIRRMQIFAVGLARAMKLTESEVLAVEAAGLLHDIGKLAVPEHILSKPGPLTAEEFEMIRIHPQIGAEIIATVPFPYPVAPVILCHHERWDGGGYPLGLRGKQIPLGARILSAVDYYETVTSDRPYHPGLSQDSAVELIRHESGKALDPTVVRTFIGHLPALIAEAAAEEERMTSAENVDVDPRGAMLPAALPKDDRVLESVFENIALAHREMYTLYELAQAIGTSLGIADTMELISSKLSKVVPWSACALFLHEPEGDTLTCRFASGLNASTLRKIIIKRDELLLADGSSNRRAIVIDNPDSVFDAPAATAPMAVRSAIVCPLFYNDTFLGCLAFYHADMDRYTDEHRRLLERIAEQASAVIYNSIIFERTQEESLTDSLTGLPNRRSMVARVGRDLARAERLHSTLAMIVLDLDGFKAINDTYGHQAGDRALRELTIALQAALRPYDLCVRYAGDEFVIVLSDCSREAAEIKRVELQQQVSRVAVEVLPGNVVRLAASAGVAIFPDDGATYEALLNEADNAMYRDKKARRAAGGALTVPGAGAAGTIGAGKERRRYPRVPGPFDGWRLGPVETPVRIFDLNEGGCFMSGFTGQEIGKQFLLRINLPCEGTVTVTAEAIHDRGGLGFAVRFVGVTEQTRAVVARAVDKLLQLVATHPR